MNKRTSCNFLTKFGKSKKMQKVENFVQQSTIRQYPESVRLNFDSEANKYFSWKSHRNLNYLKRVNNHILLHVQFTWKDPEGFWAWRTPGPHRLKNEQAARFLYFLFWYKADVKRRFDFGWRICWFGRLECIQLQRGLWRSTPPF